MSHAPDEPVQYWVRTEQGRVWGPYTVEVLRRMRSQLSGSCDVSLDGKAFKPSAGFPELKDVLSPAAPRERAVSSAVLSPGLAAAYAIAGAEVAEAGAPPERGEPRSTPPEVAKAARPTRTITPPPFASAPPPPAAAPPAEETLPEDGDLDKLSPVRLYALAASTSASGWLTFDLESGRMIQLSFRRGVPEHLASDDPDLSLVRFLQQRGTLTPAQGQQAEEHAQRSNADIVSSLFALQLIPPAEAHRLLGDHAQFLLDRAMTVWRGKFSFERDAPPPPGAFPLGQRWTLLAESIRRLEPGPLRARLGKRLQRPVLRSGGLGVGRVEELALNAQEARLYGSIDGTRTGEELLRVQDAAVTLRLLYLLFELGHLAFAEEAPEAPRPPPASVAVPAPASASAASSPSASPQPPDATTTQPTGQPKLSRPTSRPVDPPRGPPPMVNQAARVEPARPPSASPPAPTQPSAAPPRPTTPQPPRPSSSTPSRPTTPSTPSRPTTPSTPSRPTTPAPPAAAPGPTVGFATGPEGETLQDQLLRLRNLREKLAKANHFDALGVNRKTTAAEVKRIFFLLARELHPDTVTDPSQRELHALKQDLFARVSEAAGVLSDEKRRKEYEDELDGNANKVDVARIFAAEESFQRAEIMIKARKYQEGLALLEEAISLNDQEAEFYAWRGYARFLLSKDRKLAWPDSSADVKHALKLVEKCLPAHLFLGHMAKAIGELKQAESSYQRVLALDPKHVEAQRELRMMGVGLKK